MWQDSGLAVVFEGFTGSEDANQVADSPDMRFLGFACF